MTLEQISKLLDELGRGRFWGNLQIDFQDGQPVVVRKTESFKTLTKGNN